MAAKQRWKIGGLILAAIGAQIAGLPNWSDALTPTFVGGTLGVIAVVFKALSMDPMPPESSLSESALSNIRKTGAAVLLAASLGAGVTVTQTACAKQLHIAVAADTAVTQALHQALAAERGAYAAGVPVVVANHEKYLKTIRQADKEGIALTDAIDAWRKAGASPSSVPALVLTVREGLQQILTDLSDLPPDNDFVSALRKVLKLLS